MTELLLIVFVVLKLAGEVEWSWLWVLSPLWVGILLRMLKLWVEDTEK